MTCDKLLLAGAKRGEYVYSVADYSSVSSWGSGAGKASPGGGCYDTLDWYV